MKEKLFSILTKTIYKKIKVYHLLIIWLLISFMRGGEYVEKTYYQVNKNGKMKNTSQVATITTYKSKAKRYDICGKTKEEGYYENGQLNYLTEMVCGNKVGLDIQYAEDGSLIHKRNYKDFKRGGTQLDGWQIEHSTSPPYDLSRLTQLSNEGNYNCDDGRQAFRAVEFREVDYVFARDGGVDSNPIRWEGVSYGCGFGLNKNDGTPRSQFDGVTNLKDRVNGGFFIYEWYAACCLPSFFDADTDYSQFIFKNCCGTELYSEEKKKLQDLWSDHLKENNVTL